MREDINMSKIDNSIIYYGGTKDTVIDFGASKKFPCHKKIPWIFCAENSSE